MFEVKKKKKSTMGGRGSNKLFQYLQDHKKYLLIYKLKKLKE